jgi:membrane-associated phospholipid phosphatase
MSLVSVGTQALHPLVVRAKRFISVIGLWMVALARPPRIALPARAFVIEREHLRVGAIGALIAVALSMGWLDALAIKWAGQLPSGIVDSYNEITDYGRSSWVLWPTGILVLLIAAATTMTARRASQLLLAAIAVRFGFVFLAVGLPGLFVTVIKRWIGRVRPSELGPFAYHPLSWDSAYASLPSGHSAAAFSALVAIGAIFPRARPLLWIYAITIAMSRVIIAAHFPSDVLAGAVVGAFGAVLVREWFAARRLGFYTGQDGKVHALPGPSLRLIKRLARAAAGK